MTLLDRLPAMLKGGRVAAAALAISVGGAALIVSHEGTVPAVYMDPAGIPTACTGHTATVTHQDVGKAVSAEVCANLLKQDLRASELAVKRLVKVPITQEQYDALVSFTFNVGEGNLRKSTLLRRLNAGQCREAAKEFSRWVYAKGKKYAGLVRRRAEEAALFATGCQEDS